MFFFFFLVLPSVTTIVEFLLDPMMKGLVLSPFYRQKMPRFREV